MSSTSLLSRNSLVETLAKYIGIVEARKELDRVCLSLGLESKSMLSSEDFEKVVEAIENSLGKEVGGAMAHAVITDKLEVKREDVGRFYASFYRMRRQLLERQRKAENLNEELTRLKELYENVSRSIPIGLCSIDMDFNVTTWNREMESLTGIPASEAIGMKAPGLLPEYEPLLIKALQLKEAVRKSRFKKMRKDGVRRIESLIINPLVDRFDVLRGLVIAVQDITGRVELEENMLRAEKLASVGRLAAGVAHEVGNPLTSISALVQELATDGRDNAPLRIESLDLIAHHIKRISEILNSLVDYSRKKDVAFAPCSLNEIISKAVPLLKLGERGDEIEVKLESEDGLPLVYCDHDQIEQVLVNLLFNAADAMEGRGTVTVRVSRSSGSTVRVSVRDQGCGMTSEAIKHAFTPFFTTKPVGKGTGLGLYACYNILENHNSRLNISSAPGKGAVAEFDLAIAQNQR